MSSDRHSFIDILSFNNEQCSTKQSKPSAWVVLSFVTANMNHMDVVGGRDICASDKRTHGQTRGEIIEELSSEMVPSYQFQTNV